MSLFKINLNDEIAVTSTGDGTITNTASVTCIENPQSITGKVDVIVHKVVALSITKKVDPTDVTSGVTSTVTFTIIVQNAGPSTATGVVISDTVPVGFVVTAVTSTSGKVNWTSPNNNFTVDGITLTKNGQNAQATVTVTTSYIG